MPVESASWYVYLSVKITTHWIVSIKNTCMLACWYGISRESNANIIQICKLCQSLNFFIYTPKRIDLLFISRHPITTNCHCCMPWEQRDWLVHAYTKKRDLKLKPKTGTLRPFVPLQGSWGHVYWCKLIMKSALIFCLPLILHLINWLTFHVIWCNFSIGLEQFWHLYCIATDEILPYIILVHMYYI